MDKSERIDKLSDAQELIRRALDLIEEAMDGHRNYDATVIMQSLEIVMDGTHSYLTRDASIQTLIDEIEEEADEEELEDA